MQRHEQKLIVVVRVSDSYILSIQYSDDGLNITIPQGYTKHEITGTTDSTILSKRKILDGFDLGDPTYEYPSEYVYDSVNMTASIVFNLADYKTKKKTEQKEIGKSVFRDKMMDSANIETYKTAMKNYFINTVKADIDGANSKMAVDTVIAAIDWDSV